MKNLNALFKRRQATAAPSSTPPPSADISPQFEREIVEVWREENDAAEKSEAREDTAADEHQTFSEFLANFRRIIRADCEARGVRFNLHKANLLAREAWEAKKDDDATSAETAPKTSSSAVHTRSSIRTGSSSVAPRIESPSLLPVEAIAPEVRGLDRTRAAIRNSLTKSPPKLGESYRSRPSNSKLVKPASPTKADAPKTGLRGLALLRAIFKRNREAASK